MGMKYKPILCLDFDGVIHSYTSKWQGPTVIQDPPVYGAFEAIEKYLDVFRVAVYSTRSQSEDGINAMIAWFEKHGFDASKLEFPVTKPPALVTIDDRAVRFEGTFPDADYLKRLKPWNK